MNEKMARAVERLVAPLRRRLDAMVARAVVRSVRDTTGVQELAIGVLAGEDLARVERFQNYGHTGVPPPASASGAPEAVVVFVGGDRSHGLVVALDDRRHRLRGLAPGESAQYNHVGTKIICRADGSVEVVPALGQPAKVVGDLQVSGDLDVDGDVDVGGKVDAGGDVTAVGEISDSNPTTPTLTAMRANFNSHTHPANNNVPNTTPM